MSMVMNANGISERECRAPSPFLISVSPKLSSSISQLTGVSFQAVVVQTLLALVALQFPVTGYCDSGSGWVNSLFEAKGKNMKEVAVKVTELPEQYKINVRGLDFSPNGKHLAVLSANRSINIWEWQSGRIARTLETPQGASGKQIRYSPDGHLLAVCHNRATNDTVARIWNTDTWEIAHDIVDHIPGSGCNAIVFAPDGKSLIRGLDRLPKYPPDNLILYDTSIWQPVWGLQTKFFYSHALAISPDGKFVALGGEVIEGHPIPFKEQIVIVDMEQRAIVRTISDTVTFTYGQLAWSPDGASLAAIGRRAWDGSANGGHGAYTGGPDTVMIFDAHSGKQMAGEQFGVGGGGYLSIRYTPDGKYLIEGDRNGMGTGGGVRIWDGQHRELLQEIAGNAGSLAVSRDGNFFAMGVDKKTMIWQLK